MATKALITPEQYLAMHFPEREPEYVRGEMVERPMPDDPHAAVQAQLAHLLLSLKTLLVRIELRIRIQPEIIRIPDVCAFTERPTGRPVATRPLLVCEIISPEDSYSRLLEKLEQYRVCGISYIWIIDPQRRTLHIYNETGLISVPALTLPPHGFSADIEQLTQGL